MNKEILARIQTSNDDVLIIDRERILNEKDGISEWQRELNNKYDYYNNAVLPQQKEWIRVLYFPPNVNNANKALQGVIHKSQVKSKCDDWHLINF